MAARRLPAHERRRQILLAAIRVFARGGLHGTTTRAIAAEADVAEALLYRHFESKEDLFIEAMRLSADKMVKTIQRILHTHIDAPDTAVSSTLMYFKRIVEEQDDFAKMVFVITSELDNPRIREVYLPYQEAALTAIEDAITHWKNAGRLKTSVPGRATAWVLFGCFQIIALMKQTERIDELHVQPVLNLMRTFIRTTDQDATAHTPAE